MTARLARAGFDVGPKRPSRRTLLDTFDGGLHAADLRLEFRDDARRELILAEGSSPPAQVTVEAAPTFVADLPSGPFGARLSPVIDVRALLPILTVTARRSLALRPDAGGKTEVAVVIEDQIAVDGAALTSRRAARDDFSHRFSEYDSKPTRRALDELLRSASDR